MLQSLHITSLFGIYTYSIDMTSNQGEGLKFITSPNGYGKTTILALIHALYSRNWDLFLQIPFRSINYVFNDGSSIRISQYRNNKPEKGMDEEQLKLSDEEPEGGKYMTAEICLNNTGVPTEIFRYDGIEGKGTSGNLLEIYSNIQPCYFVHDNRLYRANESRLSSGLDMTERPVIVTNAEDLRNKMAELKARISQITTNMKFTTPINREDYLAVSGELAGFNARMAECGLMPNNVMTEFREDNALYLGALVNTIQQIKTEFGPFLQKLELFKNIIARSDFAYKRMEIHARYGYRFIAQNEEHTILSLATLSSGEQHMVIMAYELLFAAPDESLILLDEPELSFHFLWQSNFLNNLRDIQALRPKIQWIVCTHSPQIFGRKWNLSVDLYQLQRRQKTLG